MALKLKCELDWVVVCILLECIKDGSMNAEAQERVAACSTYGQMFFHDNEVLRLTYKGNVFEVRCSFDGYFGLKNYISNSFLDM